MKTIRCREHGGTFTIESRRGRPPVRCSPENPCTNAAAVTRQDVVSRKTASVPRQVAVKIREEVKQAAETFVAAKPAVTVPEQRKPAPRVNESVVAAQAAREMLEPLEWATAGKGWTDERGMSHATLTCTRGSELLVLTWEAGTLTHQNYTLWDVRKPSNNGMPAHSLNFDPDETSDRELARQLAGMRVTWWNRISRKEETAIVGDRLEIKHVYSGKGDETPGERIITFADHSGTGFRSFRVDALISIG